jgi:hypothetical protein
LGFWGDLQGPWHLVHVWVAWLKTHCFLRFRATVLGFRGDLQGPWNIVHVWVTWTKTHSFCVLGYFSWPVAHIFGVPGWFTRPMKLSTCLSGMTKNSSFFAF